MTAAPKRVFTVSFGQIGDFLMFLSCAGEVHELYPETTFLVLVTRSAPLMRELASAYSYIEITEVHTMSEGIRFVRRLLSAPHALVGLSITGNYSLSLRMLFMLLRMQGAPSLGIGAISGRTHGLPFREVVAYDPKALVISNFRRTFSKLFPRLEGKEELAPKVSLSFPQIEVPKTPYIVLHIFAANPKRSFPPKRWHALLAELRKRYPNYAFALTAAPVDAAAARDLAHGISNISFYTNYSLRAQAALIQNAALYIGVDTGITHLAALLQKPMVVIGNRSNPTWLPSYNPKAHIVTNPTRCTCTGTKNPNDDCTVYEDGKPYFRCLYDISDEAFFAAVGEKLS